MPTDLPRKAVKVYTMEDWQSWQSHKSKHSNSNACHWSDSFNNL